MGEYHERVRGCFPMITPQAFKLISMMTREKCAFACFLLSSFDLRSFIAVNPKRLLEYGANDGFFREKNEEALISNVDELVKSGFLEYGPPVRGWDGISQTVRIVPKYLLSTHKIKYVAKEIKERAERAALVG